MPYNSDHGHEKATVVVNKKLTTVIACYGVITLRYSTVYHTLYYIQMLYT